MTGLAKRGPSLFTHAVVLGAIQAVAVPWVWESTGSAWLVGLTLVGGSLLYLVLALIHAMV